MTNQLQDVCLCELTVASLWLLEGMSMFATLTTCLLLMSVLAQVVEGNCTLVVKGAQGLPGLEGLEGPNPRLCMGQSFEASFLFL